MSPPRPANKKAASKKADRSTAKKKAASRTAKATAGKKKPATSAAKKAAGTKKPTVKKKAAAKTTAGGASSVKVSKKATRPGKAAATARAGQVSGGTKAGKVSKVNKTGKASKVAKAGKTSKRATGQPQTRAKAADAVGNAPPARPTAGSSEPPVADGAAPVENPYERLHRELPDAELVKVKSGLTKKDLKALTQALHEHRAELLGDVEGLDEALHGDADGSSSVPLHMADVGSEHYEREFNLELLEHEKQTLNEIRAALQRIDNGTYGICVNSGRPIGKLRLEAKPWAKYHMDVVREREKHNL